MLMNIAIDLSPYGISGATEIVYNPTYEHLYDEETRPGLNGFEKGVVTQSGAVAVDTGVLYRPLSKGQVYCSG